jgi:chromosome segregation ATPase
LNRLEELIKQLLATLSFRVYADVQHVKNDLANIQDELSQNFETVEDIKMRADSIKKAVDGVSMQLIDLNVNITTEFDKLNQHVDALRENMMPQSNETVKSLTVV